MPVSAVLLFEDEVIVGLFPVPRRARSLKGGPAAVNITGENAGRVSFGVMNLRTGHRMVMRYGAMRQSGFRAFLELLGRRYAGRQIWLLLDAARSHVALKSQALAAALAIEPIRLPKQCPELNAMDHLWQEVRAAISANSPYANIEEHASVAENYILQLTNKKALLRAGIRAKNFWLKSFFK